MTGTYDWNPMPHILDVKCSECAGCAIFEFGEIKKITLKKDVPFFENSDLFEYRLFEDSCGGRWHGAIYYANLHGGTTAAIRDLPSGYEPADWNHSPYLARNHTDIGAISCSNCYARKQHVLRWPDDAYYSVSLKGELLWAFDRESAVELRDYIESDERKIENYRWSKFLLHVPTTFKKQNVRGSIVKQLNRILAK